MQNSPRFRLVPCIGLDSFVRATARLMALLAFAGVSPLAAAQHTITADFPGGNVVVVSNAADLVVLRADLRGGSDWFY